MRAITPTRLQRCKTVSVGPCAPIAISASQWEATQYNAGLSSWYANQSARTNQAINAFLNPQVSASADRPPLEKQSALSQSVSTTPAGLVEILEALLAVLKARSSESLELTNPASRTERPGA